MTSIIHVARNAIASNAKHGTNEPAIIHRTGRKSKRHNELELVDKATGRVFGKFVYSPHQPLSCGARVWLSIDDDNVEVRGT